LESYSDPGKVAALFKQLCLSATATPFQIDASVRALFDAGWHSVVDDVLKEIISEEAVNPFIGTLWVGRRWKQGKRRCDRSMKKLIDRGEAGRRALIHLLELLSENRSTLRFRWLVRKNREWLRPHPFGWPAVASGYNRFGWNKATVKWCEDWRTRSDMQMSDLLNLKIALSNLNRHDEAWEVVRAAEKLPPDHSAPIFKLHSALGFALAGATQDSQDRLLLANLTGQPAYYLLLKSLAKGLIKVQTAAIPDRKAAFREAHKEIREAFRAYSLPKCDIALRTLYRRTFRRFGNDTGVRWRVWREYLRTFV
jgi:hypothetical protein